MHKNEVLGTLATLIAKNSEKIIRNNAIDIQKAGDLDATLIDRLKVDQKKVMSMTKAIQEVIQIKDPIGEVLSQYQHPNGMLVENRVVPFGRILIIYESRPDVTIEAAISAFKAGNQIYLKGGKESLQTNLYLVDLWHQALKLHGYPTNYVTYLNTTRNETQTIIKENPYRIDLIIPRGGEALINYVRKNSSIPIVISGRGNNFAFIDESAEFSMTKNIVLNGKSRLSVCNALDKVIVHKDAQGVMARLPELFQSLIDLGMTIYGGANIRKIFPKLKSVANDDIYYDEFLGPEILFDLADNLDDGIKVINKYSGGHSAVIITEKKENAIKFQSEVDCAAVLHNASTRFTDGGQFGLGAEIAISTQKLHFRGPLGLAQLVTNKWFVSGTGQIRI